MGFLIALLVLPTAIGSIWLQTLGRGKTLVETFFFPVEILGVFLPALLFTIGLDRKAVLRWRRAPAVLVAVAGTTSLGWGGLLTYAQTGWQHVTGLEPPPGIESLLGVYTARDGLLLVAGAVILPAICEETAFRGLVLSGLQGWG
ncbi:MAG: hypothetical protein KGR26_02250, partial [Cyanobacteria bacterium REEB65]|nr:hypothetical protein [Cyanobacteria bacterium REEB65]